jgi:preprotein translocase subunit Sss1
MKNSDLLKRVNALGFPLFGSEEDKDADSTLAEMVKSRELRLWEGFPVVLANSAEKGLFDYDRVSACLKKPSHKSYLASLVVLSLALYKFFDLKFSWVNELYKSLSDNGQKEFAGFLKQLKDNNDLNVAGREMSAQRLKAVFNNYFNQAQSKLNELLSVKDELRLEYSLSQVFSPKQKELFLKKLKREKLTKTEKEYFSRVVKKKVSALANPELHSLAQKLLD